MASLVSVIIPTYNRAEMVRRAIKSVLNQTYSNLECIVLDDASTDNTKEVVEKIHDDRLAYIRHETNKHASASRNTGIEHAKGNLIAFLDSDDEWLPTKLEKQVLLIQNFPDKLGLVYCWLDYYEHEKVIKQHHPTFRGYIFKETLDKQPIGNSSTLLVRRQVIEKVGGFDESLPRGNDGDFIRRVCRQYEVDLIPEVLVKVHIGHDTITSKWDTDGIWYAIKSQEIKLTKFKNELKKYPKQEANILASIGYYYSLLPDWKNSVHFFLKAIGKSLRSRKVYVHMCRSLKSFMTINWLRK